MSGKILRRVVVGALVMLALGAGGLMCERVGERGRYVTAYSTYGSGPDGTRGLFLLSEQIGAHPIHWAEDLGQLPEHGMLVALGSCDQLMRRPVTRVEREGLMRWVERGGVVVVAGVPDYLSDTDVGATLVADDERCQPSSGLLGMLARAERRSHERDGGTDHEEHHPDQHELEDLPQDFQQDPSGTTQDAMSEDGLAPLEVVTATGAPLNGLPSVGMRRPLELDIKLGRQGDTLLMRGDRPAALRVTHGRGAVILIASGSMFQNRDLGSQLGGALFARLVRAYAPHGPVIFDEFHLGVGERRSLMRYLRQAGVGAVAIQALLLIGFALWRSGARFGAARSSVAADPGGTVSYVEGVGTLYQKSRDPKGAAAIVARRALAAIAAHHHLPSSDPGALAAALEARKRPQIAADVRRLATIADDTRDLTRALAEIDMLRTRGCA